MKNLYFTSLAFLFILLAFITPENVIGQSIQYPESLYNSIQYRQVGPFRGGRAGTIAGLESNPNLYYMGTAGGGVWKTKDGGNTWTCISDGYYGGSIGAIAVSEKDPNIIYVGEGEQTVRGNVSSGRGFWRSSDAGETWESIGLKESEHVGRIRIHPDNPDLVYTAVMGNLWKPNEQRGVFRSQDGGENWEKILFESEEAGAVDLILDPNDPNIIYASTWQIKRNGYRMDSGGPGSKLWKSIDGGDNWTNLSGNKGLPQETLGIIGITVSPANSNRLWCIIEAQNGGVFKSDDAGSTWTKVSENRELRQRAWYYSRIYADTQDTAKVYVLNVGFWRSTDGGKNYERIRTPHGDHHDLWISATDPERMAIADDGGGQISYDAGENWTTYYNQPTAQFYRVTTDNTFPYRIYCAQQDNSAIRIAHRSSGNAITESDWESTAGGESAHLAPDPLDNNIVYGGTYKGYMTRKDHNTGQTRSTNIWPDNPAGSGVEVMKYRFNWNYPIFYSPHDKKKLYATSNQVHVTTTEGQSWEVISPDLTRANPATLYSSGGPITQDNTGVEFYATIFAATESEYEKGVIWTGSDDGLIQVTKDGGKNWNNVTPADAPDNIMWNCVDVSPFQDGGVYVAGTAYKFGDYQPYLYKSNNYGKTWTKITKGITDGLYTRTIRADKWREGLLYAGTEWGMFVSFDDGSNWQEFQLNLPTVAIRDLHVRDHNLIVATHGRSIWIIDDLTPLHQLSDKLKNKNVHLFTPKPSYRLAQGGRGRANTKKEGTNHPNGTIFNYFIHDLDSSAIVKLEILESNGDLVRTYDNDKKTKGGKIVTKEGGNTFVWDMRYDGFKEFDGMIFYSSPNRGPKAIPGTYKARLTINESVEEVDFEIVPDPRLPNTQEDYKNQFDFLIKVRDEVSKANQAIIDIREIKSTLEDIKENNKSKKGFTTFDESSEEFINKLDVIENNIHMTKNQSYQDPLNYGIRINNRLAFLMTDQQRGDYPPTQQAEEFRQSVTQELHNELEVLDSLIKKEIPQLNLIAKPLGITELKINRKSKNIRP